MTTSCKKEIITTELETSESDQVTNKPTQIFIDENGKTIDYESIDLGLPDFTFSIEAYNEDLNQYTIRYFESEERLYAYSKLNKEYAIYARKIEQIREVRALAIANGDIYLENESDQLSVEMTDLLRKIGLENNSNDDRDVGFLFDESNGHGDAFLVSGTPQFSLFWFRNDASSVLSTGAIGNYYFTRTWFRGSNIIVPTIAVPLYYNFFGEFNNNIESTF